MSTTGPSSFFVILAAVHAVIAVYVVYRVVTHPTIPVEEQSDYIALPARGTAVTANLHPDVIDTTPLPNIGDPEPTAPTAHTDRPSGG